MKIRSRFARSITAAALTVVVAVTGLGGASQAQAASNAVPSYEVKFLLDAEKVLTSNQSLQPELRSEFSVTEEPTYRLVEYFDTDSQELGQEGWNVRFRKKADKTDYELTYKKRFPIENGNIEAALDAANAAGFSSDDDNYEAEVDWGYSKQTLSFSNTKKESAPIGLVLPSEQKALDMLLDRIPGKMNKTLYRGWGEDMLSQSRARGPVSVTKYKGEFEGLEVDIEVWMVQNEAGTGEEPIIEISFKTDEYTDAAIKRSLLADLLDAKGWLIHADSFKTNMVLDRY